MDIHNFITDIHKSVMDTRKSIMDIHNSIYGYPLFGILDIHKKHVSDANFEASKYDVTTTLLSWS